MSSSAEHAASAAPPDEAPAESAPTQLLLDGDGALASSGAPAEGELRHYTSAKARHTLEGIFRHKPYPSPEMCKNLAKQFGCMTPKQVQNWFQNRRQREKKLASLNPAVGTPAAFLPQMRVQYAMPQPGFAPMGWMPTAGPPMPGPMPMMQGGHPSLAFMMQPGAPMMDASGHFLHYPPQPMPMPMQAPPGQPGQQLHLVPSTMVPQYAQYGALPTGGVPPGGMPRHSGGGPPPHAPFGAGPPQWPPRGS